MENQSLFRKKRTNRRVQSALFHHFILLTRLQEKGSVQVDKDADVATYAPNFTREEINDFP